MTWKVVEKFVSFLTECAQVVLAPLTFLYHNLEHWHATGLHTEPQSLLTLPSWLCICSHHHHNKKFTDDTICIDDESVYSAQVQNLVRWCSANLSLITRKTKELIIHFRGSQDEDFDLFFYEQWQCGACIKFKVIEHAHLWGPIMVNQHEALLKKAQQWLLFSRVLKKLASPNRLLWTITAAIQGAS